LSHDYHAFQQRNSEIIAIAPDSADKLRDYWAKEQIPFPAIPDPDKRILDALGQEFKLLKFGRMPAVVIVDTDGEIHHAHYGNSPSDIPENAEVLGMLDTM
jgi:mycoredoxin-dependent peroxiredoxin